MGLARFIFLIIMLSAGARAFTSISRHDLRGRCIRSMSSESIVDICTQKIKDALDAKDVKVTGTDISQ